jgi:aliphatic nitrilase
MNLPKFKAAAVQAAPVFLDTEATIDKAISLIEEAAGNGAKIVAFPEVFVPGYPYWNWITDPVSGGLWFEKLVRASVQLDGPELLRLRNAAKKNAIHVVIGINERSRVSLGTIYNTMAFIASDGRLLGRHRKLVPTWAEKLSWAPGDGAGLRVYETDIGPLGGLACGENTNTLARFTLLAQGELIHIASYISLPVAPPDYDMAEAIKLRAMAHSFEGKVFTIVSCSTISEEIVAQMELVTPDARQLLKRSSSAFSGIIGPDGRVIGEALIDREGIAYAEIDLGRCIQLKQMHDIVGHYNRFDIFDLRVNRRELNPATLSSPTDSNFAPNEATEDSENSACIHVTETWRS